MTSLVAEATIIAVQGAFFFMLLHLRASPLFTCRIVLLKQKNCLSLENTLLLLQSFIKTVLQHLLSGVKKHCDEIKKEFERTTCNMRIVK